MNSTSERTNDLVLAFNEFAYVLDTQTGNISVMVGPLKKALERTDQPILFEPASRSYKHVSMREAAQKFPFADDNSYIVLENPTTDDAHPKAGVINKIAELQYGKTVIVRGPITFPLYPGQSAAVIDGHQLQSNQYVLLRQVSDGKLSIIKGTECSFFIPETGSEVVPDKDGKYVRSAVSVERMQYCVLLDENGEKRYEKGPQVVFPQPTERFITQDGSPIFNAIELNENMGLYIKVTADCENNKAGEELFITGKEQMIYYPRPEHAIIKYGDSVIHYAVAIPKGEARYVLDKRTGDVSLVRGACMFLPDPRYQVIIKRKLTPKEVMTMFPGNDEAVAVNATIAVAASAGLDDAMECSTLSWSGSGTKGLTASPRRSKSTKEVTDKLFSNVDRTGGSADYMTRNTSYTPSRTIELDTKYEGAVMINVWPGYAVQVVNKAGIRKVVVGPASILLEYDETLEVLELSTGTPKTSHPTIQTAYLCIANNRVSDVVYGMTKDFVQVEMHVAYRVNFIDDNSKWFSVSNYIKLLTEHCRSMIRVAIKRSGIEELNANYVDLVRDTILGKKQDKEGRTGRMFVENNMFVYDMEVFGLNIKDAKVAQLLQNAQVETMTKTVQANIDELTAAYVGRSEAAKRLQLAEKALTALKTQELDNEVMTAKREASIREADHKLALTLKNAEHDSVVRDVDAANKILEERHATVMTELEVNAYERRAQAVTPKLIEALIASGNSKLAAEMVKHLPPATGELGRAYGLGGIDSLIDLVEGTGVADAIRGLQKEDSDE